MVQKSMLKNLLTSLVLLKIDVVKVLSTSVAGTTDEIKCIF